VLGASRAVRSERFGLVTVNPDRCFETAYDKLPPWGGLESTMS